MQKLQELMEISLLVLVSFVTLYSCNDGGRERGASHYQLQRHHLKLLLLLA